MKRRKRVLVRKTGLELVAGDAIIRAPGCLFRIKEVTRSPNCPGFTILEDRSFNGWTVGDDEVFEVFTTPVE